MHLRLIHGKKELLTEGLNIFWTVLDFSEKIKFIKMQVMKH